MATRGFPLIKPAVGLAALAPFVLLTARGIRGELGANPIEAITHETGIWALRFLLITLAVTPLRRLTGWSSLIGLRRTLGLFAFFYAALHFCTYLVLDQFFDVASIADDIAKRLYITAGFAALVLLIPLAVTSSAAMIRRLGGKKWALLHRLVFVSAILAAVHFSWLVKADVARPALYGMILATLLGFRLWYTLAPSRASSGRRAGNAIPRIADGSR
jgi:sulfoxide reductase heme-binding subunit YedZ